MNSPADPRRPGTSPGQSSSLPGNSAHGAGAAAPGPGTWGYTEPWYLGALWDLTGQIHAAAGGGHDPRTA